jgi:hypothetical protein
MTSLKQQCDSAKPLGLAKCDASSELMVVYDGASRYLRAHACLTFAASDIACFVDKHGVPSRSSGYVRWETKADAFAQRGRHVLLFSPEFVEVREVNTGRLVQVLEGSDVRLLHAGRRAAPASAGVLCAMRGAREDRDGTSERVLELLQTAEIDAVQDAKTQAVWDEWDMA